MFSWWDLRSGDSCFASVPRKKSMVRSRANVPEEAPHPALRSSSALHRCPTRSHGPVVPHMPPWEPPYYPLVCLSSGWELDVDKSTIELHQIVTNSINRYPLLELRWLMSASAFWRFLTLIHIQLMQLRIPSPIDQSPFDCSCNLLWLCSRLSCWHYYDTILTHHDVRHMNNNLRSYFFNLINFFCSLFRES